MGPGCLKRCAGYRVTRRPANKRLFKIREQLAERYEELSTPDLLKQVPGEPLQLELTEQEANSDAAYRSPPLGAQTENGMGKEEV